MEQSIPLSLPYLSKEDEAQLVQCFDRGFVGVGPATQLVREKLNALLSTRFAWVVNSGSSAILLSLKALGVKKGDDVLLSAYTCSSILNQVWAVGAKPVLAQPLDGTFFNNPVAFADAVTRKTKAIIFYHPFGYYDPAIREVKKLKVPIIEDITHSWCASDESGRVGDAGDIIVSSLGSTKYVTAGTGGMIATRLLRINRSIEILLDYDYLRYGTDLGRDRSNCLLGDLNAALLMTQLNKLPEIIARRSAIALRYHDSFASRTIRPYDARASYFRFFVNAGSAKAATRIVKHLKASSISAVRGGILIPDIVLKKKSRSVALHSRIVAIPIYPSISDAQVSLVIEKVNELL